MERLDVYCCATTAQGSLTYLQVKHPVFTFRTPCAPLRSFFGLINCSIRRRKYINDVILAALLWWA